MAGSGKEVAHLHITLREDGSVDVEGCIGMKLQAYGMLECAKDAITKFNDRQEALDTAKTVAKPMHGPFSPLNGYIPIK